MNKSIFLIFRRFYLLRLRSWPVRLYPIIKQSNWLSILMLLPVQQKGQIQKTSGL